MIHSLIVNLNAADEGPMQHEGKTAIWPTERNTKASVTLEAFPDGTGAPTWNSATGAVRWSNSLEGPWFDFASAVNLTHNNPKALDIDISSVGYIAVVLTNPQGAALLGRLRVCMKEA